MTDETTVAFGPSDERLRLSARSSHARGEVEESGPRARLACGQPVVVAARVVNEPAQTRRVQTARIQPLVHRDAVERDRFGVVRAVGDWDSERPSSLRVAPARPTVNLRVEVLELARVLGGLARVQVEALVPATAIKNSLFGVAADELLGDYRLALVIKTFEHAHLVQERDERAVLLQRRGQVVCAPRVRHDAVRVAASGSPAGRGFEFEQNEIFKARAQQTPSRRETSHAAADNDDARTLPRFARRLRPQPVSNQMTYTVGRADYLAFGQRRHVRARAARGQSEGHAEEGRQKLAPIHNVSTRPRSSV